MSKRIHIVLHQSTIDLLAKRRDDVGIPWGRHIDAAVQNNATNAATVELLAAVLRKCGAREMVVGGGNCPECPVRLHGFDINCATASAGLVTEAVREWGKK